ncbi:MAG: DUF2085 domain-containing protein [Bacillota bacterium]
MSTGFFSSFFNLAGSLVCHQLPSRSLYSEMMKLPVCARDTGIYSGILLSMLYLAALRRLRAQKPPGIAMSVFLCLLMLPMILDGMLSYAGLIDTNNARRLYTGLFFGLAVPFFLVPAAHYNPYGPNDKPVLKSAVELIPVYGAGILLCMLLLEGRVPYLAAALIFFAGLLFLLTRVSYTIFARTRRFKRRKVYLMSFSGTVFALAVLYLLSSFVLQPLKDVLLAG